MHRKVINRLLRLPLRKGFSLVEVIFAASLLSLVMLMMFNLYPTSLLTIRQAEHRLEANSLAQSVLESFRAGDFASCLAVAQPTNPLNTVGPSSGSPSYGPDGVQYWTVVTTTPIPQGTATHLADMTVTCYWNEQADAGLPWAQWTHKLTQELYICDIQR